MKKADVNNVDDVKIYLIEQAKSNKRLYHYTTYESLLEIIKNKTFRLTRCDLLNDKKEYEFSNTDYYKKSYMLSFTRDKEYVSMWAMYGKPSGIKIRLDFSNVVFRKCLNTKFFNLNFPRNSIDYFVQLSDVTYLDKNINVIKHNTKPFENFIQDSNVIEGLSGYIKYDAWEFEKETRLKIDITDKELAFQNDFPKYIEMSISDELIKTFNITFNPWMSENMKEEIKNSLNRVSNYELTYQDSIDDGEISEF